VCRVGSRRRRLYQQNNAQPSHYFIGIDVVGLCVPADVGEPGGTARPASTSAASPAVSDPLTGYGATVAAWNAHHTPDPDFDPGAVYDPDPSLPKINGHTGAKYVEVNAGDGRILNYVMNLPASTKLPQAVVIAEAELPADAKILWQAKLDSCVQLEFVSPTLGRYVGKDATQVLVEFEDVDADGDSTLNPTVFNGATLGPDNSATAAQGPGC